MRYRDIFGEDCGCEAVPANNAGSGKVAGIGVGPEGEPGYPPELRRKRRPRAGRSVVSGKGLESDEQ